MDFKELEKLARLCRKYGISHINVGDVSLSLDNPLQAIPSKRTKSVQDAPKEETENPFSEEDVLLWSAGN